MIFRYLLLMRGREFTRIALYVALGAGLGIAPIRSPRDRYGCYRRAS